MESILTTSQIIERLKQLDPTGQKRPGVVASDGREFNGQIYDVFNGRLGPVFKVVSRNHTEPVPK